VVRPSPVPTQHDQAADHESFFSAAPLRGAGGTLGTVFGYQGSPSWVFATLRPSALEPARYDVELVARDGRTLSLGRALLGGSRTTWGACIPLDLTDVAALRFRGPDGRVALVALFPDAADPWTG
jgi:hypothetical protein